MKDRTYRKLSAYMGLYLIACIIYQISYFHSGWLYGWNMNNMTQMAEAYNALYMMLASAVIWVALMVFMGVVKQFLRYWVTPKEA